MGGDLKFLALIYGINAANSKYPCIYCTNNFETKLDKKEPLSFSKRTIDESKALYELKDIDSRKGYIEEALFDFIDFDHIVVDLLHLYLRITDKFFNILIDKIIKADGLHSQKIELHKRNNFYKLVCFLKDQCKITNSFYLSKKSIFKYKLRSLNANERLRVFEKLKAQKIVNLFPRLDKKEAELMDFVFTHFHDTIKKIKSKQIDKNNIESFKAELFKWVKFYIKLDPSDEYEVTPYIHIYAFHLPFLITSLENINFYNTQGLEKLNHFSTQYYYFSTNRHHFNNEYLIQMLKKRNRTEFFDLGGQEKELLNLRNN